MPVNQPELLPALDVPGFKVGTASCGVKSADLKGKRTDLTIIAADVNCHAAGTFTQNRLRAACVDLGEQAITDNGSNIRAIVANSGNANAGTGIREEEWAQMMIATAADSLGINSNSVLSASTGVIGTPFPIERIVEGIGEASACASGWQEAAHAIRTTDTYAKWGSKRVGDFTITGICKGSGMIHPNMATMLGFIATDAPLSQKQLQPILKRAIGKSFNSISVDGDTSTNDTVYLLSSGLALGHGQLADTDAFEAALTELCIELAQMIVRDGEGVSKFVTINIEGAASEEEARHVGRTIAISPLVKTAFAGSDANWGRIVAAAGNAGINFDPDKISLCCDDVVMMEDGSLHPDYSDEAGMLVFAQPEFSITLNLGMGEASATIWTGDLTHEYITINAEYRT
ncbi:glutamate N-acetyltransferase / amino-acid N-acetyltransferase [Mariprofundus micogutta]|uniref:Arginine biosynthesis bifunctional protein ArgJ n=1 Tax=Mariprofundus micogutta TaxID=1921010 RepID=A0A1L8CME8_9PROT|nr:bifunctional glutamate N-acetyltransferase/amino-acid acetyltransferase ArgJ [Mariprofundus micogutta]GAV20088.1 glutamate N-acetyltransferase / amino-acid N-acetyltransferase [Mariprofundus micogutta]